MLFSKWVTKVDAGNKQPVHRFFPNTIWLKAKGECSFWVRHLQLYLVCFESHIVWFSAVGSRPSATDRHGGGSPPVAVQQPRFLVGSEHFAPHSRQVLADSGT